MKKVYIMRHGRAEYNVASQDIDRKLTERGRKDCENVAEYLNKNNEIPDIIIASSSTRTKTTAEIIQSKIKKIVPLTLTDKLYRAEPETILSIISNLSEAESSALIIAHNPGIEYICNNLSDGQVNDHSIKMRAGVRPGSISCFIFPTAKSWHDVLHASATLQWFHCP